MTAFDPLAEFEDCSVHEATAEALGVLLMGNPEGPEPTSFVSGKMGEAKNALTKVLRTFRTAQEGKNAMATFIALIAANDVVGAPSVVTKLKGVLDWFCTEIVRYCGSNPALQEAARKAATALRSGIGTHDPSAGLAPPSGGTGLRKK